MNNLIMLDGEVFRVTFDYGNQYVTALPVCCGLHYQVQDIFYGYGTTDVEALLDALETFSRLRAQGAL